jgi:crossover junction endodeoxyribonuclease RusA
VECEAEGSVIKLTLPYPISANRLWRTRVVGKIAMTYLSPEGKAYKHQVAMIAKAAGITSPIAGRVAIDYTLYPNRPQDYKRRMAKDPEGWDDTVMCLDLDNAQKVLLDSLKGIVMEDDKWVRSINARRAEPDGVGRIEVTVREIKA